jgi:hypothetical protein
VEEQDLSIDSKAYTFSNSSNGGFHLSFAEEKDYFIGSAVDSDTGISYALITYNSAFYLVVADDTGTNAEYNGSYTDNSFAVAESGNYDSGKRKVTMSISGQNSADNIRLTALSYNSNYTINIFGFYKGVYYQDGKAATGVYAEGGHYIYYVNGQKVTTDGWYVEGNSSVMTAYSEYEKSAQGTRLIYLENGYLKTLFDGENAYSYTKTKRTLIKDQTLTILDGAIIFDSKGNLAEGLIYSGDDIFYASAGKLVNNKVEKVGTTIYYFGSDGKAVKSVWKEVNNIVYYFNDKGIATKRYFTEQYSNSNYAGKLYIYSSNKWVNKAEGLVRVASEYIYFEKGKKKTVTKWYVKSDSTRYYIKSGILKYKVVPDGIRYKCYEVSDSGSIVLADSKWMPAYKNVVIKTDSTGYSVALFYKSTHKVFGYAGTYRTYTSGSWHQLKNNVLNVQGKYYYFNSKGAIDKTSGWRTLSNTSAAYVSSDGNVTKYVYYDSAKKVTTYKTGNQLNESTEGLVSAAINKNTVYYYSDKNGICVTGETVTVEEVDYVFDAYGRCIKKDGIGWDYDSWMKRVVKAYLGKTGIYCNVFVANALRYVGDNDNSEYGMAKYTSYSKGGIIVNSENICSSWALRKVTGTAIVSNGGSWDSSKEYELTADREDFSYDALEPGDLIVYYLNGEPNHIAIFLGKFDSATKLKEYLKSLGVSNAACEKYVHDWHAGTSDSDAKYWVIQGGMGSNNQVYISNSAKNLSGQIAKKIIHVKH